MQRIHGFGLRSAVAVSGKRVFLGSVRKERSGPRKGLGCDCLLADIEIRQRTGNRPGLEDSLRAVNAGGGNVEVHWQIERVFALGDRATAVAVLRELHDRMKATPVHVDLSRLWKRLGVKLDGQRITFDDSAPLANIRRAITARRAAGDSTSIGAAPARPAASCVFPPGRRRA